MPLMPQLTIGFKRTRGEVPEQLRSVGTLGARHVAALISLAVHGPASVGELATRLAMTLNHASLVTRQLDRAGLITRREHEDDKRRIIVSIAPSRANQVQEMAERVAQPLKAFLATLGPDDADRFITQLAGLASHLNEPEAR